ncbi:dienelactone hydrolase family protein [Vibrio sp. Isolate31]|uniref:dienelactone hydrolase family protein n=1 Tax=unclassified Vibrio TaxID=2614977 RepID=UPI001EFD40AF|nr:MULTISPECIES: dienelactone hydrolase family protein [unclassified Vibrio]MCG9552097.1 dienelactone hydrolase family protein [Vibrio sp. Isolate32]MCG9599401.1 dienelactone hydrolase family protein [Vibrio sp. Isolate31]
MRALTALGLFSVLLPFAAHSGENVIYQVDGMEYEGYWSEASDQAPLVLLILDWDGLTDYEKKRSEMLNELGYNVFAIDLFGKDIRPTEVKDKKQHTGELYNDREKMRALLNAGAMEAQRLGGSLDNNVMMGYCFGGAAVLEATRAGIPSKAYVTFHGGLSTPKRQDYSQTKAPVVVFHGTADSMITMEDFGSLATQLESTKAPHEMITYSGAPHAFTVFGSNNYHHEADQKSWQRFTHVLETTTR